MNAPEDIGVLFIGHGTRKPEGIRQFTELCDQVARLLPGLAVGHGFLELASPSIQEGLRILCRHPLRKILAVPVFLFEAGRTKIDIPEAIAEFQRFLPGTPILQTPALACHPALLELARQRQLEALSLHGMEPSGKRAVGLAVIGRGGSDRSAILEMRRFASLLAESTSPTWCKVGFLAVAKPNLRELLEGARRSAASTLLIQPHLFFEGQLMDEVRELVREFQGKDVSRRWIIADPYGNDPALAQVFAKMIRQFTQECNLQEYS